MHLKGLVWHHRPSNKAEQSAAAALAFPKRRPLMMIYQEKIAPPGPLPDHTEPPDVLSFKRTIESLEQENACLKEQLARMLRDK